MEVVNTPLNPNYVSGFTEGDAACFSVHISSSTNQVIATYILDLHNKEIPLLHRLQEFFGGVGNVNASLLTPNPPTNCKQFRLDITASRSVRDYGGGLENVELM